MPPHGVVPPVYCVRKYICEAPLMVELLSTTMPPVTAAFPGAEIFNVPSGGKAVLQLAGFVTSNDITHPFVLLFVHPVSVPENTLSSSKSVPPLTPVL
jgi:hypothetical protein